MRKYSFQLFFLSVVILVLLQGADATNSAEEPSALQFMSTGGFCLQGTIPWLRWELGEQIGERIIWGSFCNSDSDTGHIESAPFLAPTTLSFYLSGYAGSPDLPFFLQNLESGEEFRLGPQPPAGDRWEFTTFDLPAKWVGKPVQIVGEDHVTAVRGWFAFTSPQLPYSLLAPGEIATDTPQNGFCTGGAFPQVIWPAGRPPTGVVPWRSYCMAGDNDTGWMASTPFLAGRYARLYVAGYPGSPGVRLALQNLSTGRQLPLLFPTMPGERWRPFNFLIPVQWRGQSVRVLAEDKATRQGGWLGFALVPLPSWRADVSFALRLLALELLIFVVIMLPAVAACFTAALKAVDVPADLVAIALLTIGFVGYGAFWSYFLSRAAGLTYSYVVILSSIAVITYAVIRTKSRFRLAILRPMLAPLFLLAAGSMLIISLGLLYGKPDLAQDYAVHRFGPPYLSIDNFLPKTLADDVYQGHIPKPMVGDWLSSDRPPLQAGMALWLYAWTHGSRDLPYQIMGTICQLTFLVGLWTYLDAAKINRKGMALALATALFSGFVLFNSFFVWPKLFPVTFLFLISAYVFTDRYMDVRAKWPAGIVVGAAAAFAMLCHGGSVFGLIGIGATALALSRVPSRRFVVAAVLTAALLYLPWSLYQKYYDPPGDRLLKMHLAGVSEPHPEAKFTDLLLASYSKLTWTEIVRYKIENFGALIDNRPLWQRLAMVVASFFSGSQQRRDAAVASLREVIFLRWSWSIDLLIFAPLAWLLCVVLRRPRSPEYKQASILWLCTALTLIVWCLMMFGHGATIVYQGCYFTGIAAFAAGILALWALSPSLAALVTACHVAFAVAIYVFLGPPQAEGVATLFGPVNVGLAIGSSLAAAGFIFVLWRISGGSSEREANMVGKFGWSNRPCGQISAGSVHAGCEQSIVEGV